MNFRQFFFVLSTHISFAAFFSNSAFFVECSRSSGPCGQPQTSPAKSLRIVGGSFVQEHSWPWACALVQEVPRLGFGLTYRQFCGCSLIDKEWLVTAAHCVDKFSSRQFLHYVKVYLGVVDLRAAKSNPGKRFTVSQIIKHPGFVRKTKHNDIALLKLQQSVKDINDSIMSICLPEPGLNSGETNQQNSRSRKVCYVAGWGHLYEGESGQRGKIGSGTDRLKQTRVEIFSQFCAGFYNGGSDACQGDSGGPLICQSESSGLWTLDGVVSWGRGCARRHSPGVYTNVWIMKDWIVQTMGVDF